jgi:hypothetical protein
MESKNLLLPLHGRLDPLASQAVVWTTQLIGMGFELVEELMVEFDVELFSLRLSVSDGDWLLPNLAAAQPVEEPRAGQSVIRE